MTAHIFTSLLKNNFFCCCFCRSVFTVGAFPVPSCEEYWRGKGKEIAKDLPSFLISLVSLVDPSPSPELQPCTITVSVTVVTDCPQDITCLLPLPGKLRFLGEHFYWSRYDFKVLPRTAKANESPDWTRTSYYWKWDFDGGMEQA